MPDAGVGTLPPRPNIAREVRRGWISQADSWPRTQCGTITGSPRTRSSAGQTDPPAGPDVDRPRCPGLPPGSGCPRRDRTLPPGYSLLDLPSGSEREEDQARYGGRAAEPGAGEYAAWSV